MGSDINTVALAPNFNPHRLAITAASAADVTTKGSGVNTTGFEFLIIDASKDSGTWTSVTLELMYWSDKAAKFTVPSPAEEFVLTVPGQVKVQTLGRVAYVRIKAIAGAGNTVSLYVAGGMAGATGA